MFRVIPLRQNSSIGLAIRNATQVFQSTRGQLYLSYNQSRSIHNRSLKSEWNNTTKTLFNCRNLPSKISTKSIQFKSTRTMSSESENSTVPATTTPSITPYREFVLSTIATTMDNSLRSQLLSSETTLYDFTKQVHALGEGKDFINTLRFNIPADALPSLAQNLIEASHNTLDRIAAVAPGTHTYENTLNQMVLDDILCSPLQASLDFISDVSADKLVRDAANEGKDLLQAYAVEASARVDVYDSVNAFSITEEAKKLAGEKKRFLERVLRDFRRDGLHLPKDQLAQLVNIRKEMSSLAIKFHANVGEEDTKFTFTKQQLDGLSDDQLSALTKGETADTYIVTLKTPDYVPVMQYCAEPETRRVLEKAYNSRCIDTNTTIMEQLIVLRERQANILGFDTHAAYVLDIRMAKTPVTVKNFLETLNTRLQPLYEKDQAELLALKKEECAKTGREFDNILHPYDRSYYSRLYEASAFSIDHQKLKEYFPLDHAFKGMFKLYETMFSVEFERITQDTKSWHKDVEMYYVIDRAPGSGERDILGQFYTDMHPRQGKYSHAAVFPLVQGCVDATGEKQRITPISAIVCNFPAATAEKPSLISHSDLTTLLHEFGHCLHAMLSITELPRFAGTAVARDFVEAPSQMLENWCWQRESLAYLAKHYKTGESIPDELLTNLIKSRVALQGSFNKRQLVFGMVDQRLHTGKGTVDSNGVLTPWRPDTAKVYSDTMYDVMGFRATEGTNMIAAFGHLAGGYDATYYGYLWSEVFAADMFVSRFGKEGILNPVVGLEYRRKILQKGDSQDASEILADFLGREPNQNAFLLQKGLEIDV